jgi:hypothetical protein
VSTTLHVQHNTPHSHSTNWIRDGGTQLGENATKFSRFANYLRDPPFQMGCDLTIVGAAVDALGLLVRTGGALTADVVEFEVRRVPPSPAPQLPG